MIGLKRLKFSRWLKGIIVFSAFLGGALCGFIVPELGREAVRMNPELSRLFWPCLIFIWITAVPFYLTLWKAWLICREIAKDNSFCEDNARQLQKIGGLALSESVLYCAAAVALMALNLLHPGILLLILFLIFIGIAVAVLSGTLSYLVKKSCDLKRENDLTI